MCLEGIRENDPWSDLVDFEKHETVRGRPRQIRTDKMQSDLNNMLEINNNDKKMTNCKERWRGVVVAAKG